MTHCLIIDGSAADRHQLAELLEPRGFRVDHAGDGEAALDLCRRDMPDVIMLSDRLDRMGALEFLRRLRNTHRGGEPVVFICTGEADAQAIGTAIWQGATECLVKPFDGEMIDFKLHQFGLVNPVRVPMTATG